MKFSPKSRSLYHIPKNWNLFLILAMVFAFSCSNSEDPELLGSVSSSSGEGTQYYCVYPSFEFCYPVESSTATCSGEGGFLALSCPYNSGNNSSSSSSSNSNDISQQSSQSGGDGNSSSSNDGSQQSSQSGGNGNSNSSQSSQSSGSGNSSSSSNAGNGPVSPSTGPVAYYGKLQASGKNIVGSKTGTSTPVQVRGVSLGWSNTGWESSNFFNSTAVNAMVDDWKAEIIRVPMGYSYSTTAGEYDGSYLDDKAGNMARVKAAINAAINKGVYVIIDWHSHDAHSQSSDAEAFFEEMAKDYGSYNNVIFEIYNEPLNISWSTIKTYAEKVISKIRAHSTNLILVGTPNWDQNVNAPLNNWLSDNNVAYVMHFYAASHSLASYVTGSTTTTFQSAINAVLGAGKPVFISEYGTVSADGNGSHNATASDSWMSFLNTNNISYCAWHVNNKNEASAFFVPSFTPSASANWASTSNMTSSGQYVYSKLVAWRSNAPWNGGSGNSTVSETRCKNSDGNDYYCQWSSGCFAIDPAFSETSGATCVSEISSCQEYGSLFINSINEGTGTTCVSSYTKYCYGHWNTDCDRIGSIYISTELSCISNGGIVLNNRDECLLYTTNIYG